jgi:hypothetical protein
MFEDAMIKGIPLLFVVMGLVAWVKEFKWATGDVLRIISLLIGLVLGMGYMLTTAIPADFGGWFGYAFYGLALGLVASGVVDAVRPSAK